MAGDPKHWGYRSLARDRVIYEPLEENSDETFELHLIGEGEIDIPQALSRAVFIHRGLNYTDFYALMQTMDVVIPAFVNVDCRDIFISLLLEILTATFLQTMITKPALLWPWQSSATYVSLVYAHQNVTNNFQVPILASKRMREAYGYINDNRVVITRPQALREIAAIGAFRDARTPELEQSSVFTGRFAEDVTLMLKEGWQKSQRSFRDFKEELWKENQNSIKRALDGVNGLI